MEYSQNDQQTFRQYLLGKLGGEDLTAFEQQLLTDRKDFEDLLAAAEDDLMDEYVGGQLSNEEREAFEKHYLITPGRHEEIEFARSLDSYLENQYQIRQTVSQALPIAQEVNQNRGSQASNLTWMLRAAAAVVVFGVIPYVIYQTLPRAPQYASIELNPSIVTRADGAHRSVNLGNADTLRAELNLPREVPANAQYRAQLEGLDDNTSAWLAANVTSHDTVTVDIPANQLRKARYALKLFATSSGQPEQRIAVYNFTVE